MLADRPVSRATEKRKNTSEPWTKTVIFNLTLQSRAHVAKSGLNDLVPKDFELQARVSCRVEKQQPRGGREG